MLEHRAAGHVAEAFARDAVLGHQRLQHGREHVLVADLGIRAVTARERNAHAADHGDATNLGSNQHGAAPMEVAGRMPRSARKTQQRGQIGRGARSVENPPATMRA